MKDHRCYVGKVDELWWTTCASDGCLFDVPSMDWYMAMGFARAHFAFQRNNAGASQ